MSRHCPRPAARAAPSRLKARLPQWSIRKWVAVGASALLVLTGLGWLLWRYRRAIDWQVVPQTIAGWDTPLSLTAMALLPLIGFPIGAVNLVAGIKFGSWLGGLAVAGATTVHLLGSHLIGRCWLRGPVERWLARRRHHLPRLPHDDDRAVAGLVALVPGLPYAFRNYFLALSEVPLRIYGPICLGVYVLRAYVTIALGNLTMNPGLSGAGLIVALYTLKLGICAELIRRLYRRHRHRPTPP